MHYFLSALLSLSLSLSQPFSQSTTVVSPPAALPPPLTSSSPPPLASSSPHPLAKQLASPPTPTPLAKQLASPPPMPLQATCLCRNLPDLTKIRFPLFVSSSTNTATRTRPTTSTATHAPVGFAFGFVSVDVGLFDLVVFFAVPISLVLFFFFQR